MIVPPYGYPNDSEKKEGRVTEVKNETSIFYVQLVGEARHKGAKGRQRRTATEISEREEKKISQDQNKLEHI